MKTPAKHQEQAEETAREIEMRMQYLGVLSLLAECSVRLRSGVESDELRDSIEEALTDAQKVIPRLRWKRVLHSFDIELSTYEQCPHGNDLVPGEDAACGCRSLSS